MYTNHSQQDIQNHVSQEETKHTSTSWPILIISHDNKSLIQIVEFLVCATNFFGKIITKFMYLLKHSESKKLQENCGIVLQMLATQERTSITEFTFQFLCFDEVAV